MTSSQGDVGPRLTPSEFAQQFQACSRSLWCIAAAVQGDRSQAEDVLQEAALIGLQKINEFRPGTSFAAWMGQIVRNIARNTLRRRLRRSTVASDPQRLDALPTGAAWSGPKPVSRLGEVRGDQQSFDDRVLAALSRLGETPRACLLLRTILEAPYAEIAAVLGIPEGTAMSHVHRARHELRRLLAPAFDHTPEGCHPAT
jgi:RNA polymerase sigma-70 factor (ECF subfamily)